MLIDIGNGVRIDPEAQLRELDRQRYEDSLYEFLRAAWHTFDPAPWKDGWPIQAVAEHLQAVADGDIRKLLINIPPRTSKTSIVSVAFPAWVWAQRHHSATSGPGVQFLYASYAMSLAEEASAKCRRLIESPWYQSFWGDRFTLQENTVTKFSNDKGGYRFITSVESKVTGKGGSVIVLDDPNDASDQSSDAAIKNSLDWWNGVLSTRMNDMNTGATIVVQQRIAEDDITGHIQQTEPEGWASIILPMKYEPERSFMTPIGWIDPRTEPGELLWPERVDAAAVKALEARLGPWRSSGQLQQRPEPAGGGIIKRDWWRLWEPKEYPQMDYIIAFLDTAYTEKEMNDPSAMTVWGVFTTQPTTRANRVIGRDGKPMDTALAYVEGAPSVMLMYAWQERLELNPLVEKAAKVAKALKIDTLVVENKASGISVAQEIRRLYASERFSTQLADPKSIDKMSRLYSVQNLFAEGMVFAPDRPWADMVIKQVGQFPKGKHDDLVDTTSGALRYLRDAGLLQRSPERFEEMESLKTYPGRENAPLYPA